MKVGWTEMHKQSRLILSQPLQGLDSLLKSTFQAG